MGDHRRTVDDMNNAVVRDDVRIQDLNASGSIGKPSGRIGTNERVAGLGYCQGSVTPPAEATEKLTV